MKLTKGKLSKLYKKKNQSAKRKHDINNTFETNATTFRKKRHLNLSNKTLKSKTLRKVKGGTSSPERNVINAGNPTKTANEIMATFVNTEEGGTTSNVFIVGVSQGQYTYQNNPGLNEEKKEIDKNLLEIDDNGINQSTVNNDVNRIKIDGVISDVFGIAFGDTSVSKYEYLLPVLKVSDRDYIQINGIFVEEGSPWVFIATKLLNSDDSTANGNFSYGYIRQDKIIIRGFYDQEILRLKRYDKTTLSTFEEQYKAFVRGVGKQVVLYDKKKLAMKRAEKEIENALITPSVQPSLEKEVDYKKEVAEEKTLDSESESVLKPVSETVLKPVSDSLLKPTVEIAEEKILPIEQTFSLFYKSFKEDLVKTIVSSIHLDSDKVPSKDFTEGITSLNKSNMFQIYGGGSETDTDDYDNKLRTFFKNVNENVEEKDKISDTDVERFIKDKDEITRKLSELAADKPEIISLLHSFSKMQDENLNSDLPPTLEKPLVETTRLETNINEEEIKTTPPLSPLETPNTQSNPFASSPSSPLETPNTQSNSFASSPSSPLETQNTQSNPFASSPSSPLETQNTQSNPFASSTFSPLETQNTQSNPFASSTSSLLETQNTQSNPFASSPFITSTVSNNENKTSSPFASLGSFTQKASSFANQALDASAKAADLSIKMKEISNSQNPLEAIAKAESNGSLDKESATKLRKTYQGVEIAKKLHKNKIF